MSARGHVSKGQFMVGQGYAAAISKSKPEIRRGMFLTSDAVVDRPATLERQFPEMADVLAHAGPVPSAADLAEHWRKTAELEARIASLKAKVKAVKRK
jgi:hypothetical protein